MTQSKLRIPLVHYTGGNGANATLPLVEVNVNGHPTRFLVDTGATYHVITDRFAEQAGLHIEATSDASAEARDHTGAAFATKRASGLNIDAAGAPIARNATLPVVASKSATTEQAMNLGGFLSPRLLAPAGLELLIDLPGDQLVIAQGSLGHQEPKAKGMSLTPTGMHRCDDGHGAVRYLVSGTVDDAAVVLEVDTGSEETHLFKDSKVGLLLTRRASKSEKRTTISGEYDALRIPGVHLHAGELKKNLDVLLVPGAAPADCQFDGMLGMDVLKRCAIVLDDQDAFARCVE